MTDREWKTLYGNSFGVICLLVFFVGSFAGLIGAGYNVADPDVQWRWDVTWLCEGAAALFLILPPINTAIVKLRHADDKNPHLSRADRKMLRKAQSTAARLQAERELEQTILGEDIPC